MKPEDKHQQNGRWLVISYTSLWIVFKSQYYNWCYEGEGDQIKLPQYLSYWTISNKI